MLEICGAKGFIASWNAPEKEFNMIKSVAQHHLRWLVNLPTVTAPSCRTFKSPSLSNPTMSGTNGMIALWNTAASGLESRQEHG
jgi:hypothetical protein